MSTDAIQPQPGRRPIYPVDPQADEQAARREPQAGTTPPQDDRNDTPAAGSSDDPASDANTESANHPNDE